jgi:peroxiredoxin
MLSTVFALALGLLAAPQEAPLKVGDDAPMFSGKTLNAADAKLAVFALNRYTDQQKVVLTFGASYCEPCKKELAELKALEPKLSKAGIVLAVVIVDSEPEGLEAMRKLTVDQLKLPYPVLADKMGIIAKRWRAYTLPYTVIVDKTGKISWLHSGFKEGSIAELLKQLGI